jgi:hypothetical protein
MAAPKITLENKPGDQAFMLARYKIDHAKLTVVLTSCGRFDLLEETLVSFLTFFDPQRILISEDSDDAAAAAAFVARIPQIIEMRVNANRLGQLRSIDGLYASVETPYVVHLEDDWKFTSGVDLDNVVSFLEERPDISVVCIGYRFDARFARSARRITHEGTDYWVWDLDAHPKWFSYSFNPSIARIAFWRMVGPYARFVTEEGLSQFCKTKGLRIAMVIPSLALHIGGKRHAADPFQPQRPTTRIGRLKRSISKRWTQLKGA